MSRVSDDELDLVITAQLAGAALTELVRTRLRERGHPALRTSHGYVFQHLLGEPITVGELAERLGVTQQAASKSTAELTALGYVERHGDAADGRIRRLGLTERGRAAVADARVVRAEIEQEVAAAVGVEQAARTRRTLLDALNAIGAMPDVRGRRVVPPG